ncbi:MAG: IS1380 family transposase [Acidobacteria bacterium]|nr:IS1380 family transposase [Acidobacteriota bacterium]
MSTSIQKREARCKRRIQHRLRRRNWCAQLEPMFRGRNIHYEGSDRIRGLGAGGIGAMHLLAQRTGLAAEIDESLQLLKVHQPYHESDHVLNVAYNILCGGQTLEDLEHRRQDEVYLDAVGARVIPDPTTAGDFCRRFRESSNVEALMAAIDRVRMKVWRQQPEAFFEEAILEADGTLAPTTGECKEGMDISYNGVWGYHPLVVTLANTGEPLSLVNRSGNRPSHEGAAERFDGAIALCREAGFERILLRGDTDFSSTQHLDRWNQAGVRFLFGIDAMPKLVDLAAGLAGRAWKRLQRPVKYRVKTGMRSRPENIKEQLVVERGFRNIRLDSEEVAEFEYQPGACERPYRVVVVQKNLSVERGERVLFDDLRYFFYITNDEATAAEELVFLANERCNQENLIAQLKNGVHALRMPVNTLVSNLAYMVMASLAWTLKAWFALLLPEEGRWGEQYRAQKQTVLKMEFRTFRQAFIAMPCQILRAGRRIVYRLLAWNPWQRVFLRGVEALRRPLRC